MMQHDQPGRGNASDQVCPQYILPWCPLWLESSETSGKSVRWYVPYVLLGKFSFDCPRNSLSWITHNEMGILEFLRDILDLASCTVIHHDCSYQYWFLFEEDRNLSMKHWNMQTTNTWLQAFCSFTVCVCVYQVAKLITIHKGSNYCIYPNKNNLQLLGKYLHWTCLTLCDYIVTPIIQMMNQNKFYLICRYICHFSLLWIK